MEGFKEYSEEVLEKMDADFHDDNIDWIYEDHTKSDSLTDEFESLLRLMHIMDTLIPFALFYLAAYRNDYLERNYDGPDDGEAWSGGFAENH